MRAARAPLRRASEVPYETLCQFLYQEARLLDQRKFDQWNDLFAEGGMYWIPLEEDQEDPLNHLSLAYEDSMMRRVRINRLNHDRACLLYTSDAADE